MRNEDQRKADGDEAHPDARGDPELGQRIGLDIEIEPHYRETHHQDVLADPEMDQG